jgi:hypothetical protein
MGKRSIATDINEYTISVVEVIMLAISQNRRWLPTAANL